MMNNETNRSKLKILVFILITLSFVFNPSITISAASWDPKEVLTTFLNMNYPWEEIEISNVRIVTKIPDAAPEKIIVEKGPLGKAVFSFIFKNENRLIVKAKVKALEKVVKSKRPFKKGHSMLREDVYISKMDIRRMPKSSIKNPDKIIGKSLRKSITANVPIIDAMIEQSRVVKRGKSVVLEVSHMGLHIKAAGKTKENSHVGSHVRAVNLLSNKEVVGVLIDENTVKVEL